MPSPLHDLPKELGYFTNSYQYFDLVTACVDMMENSGNKTTVFSDVFESDEEGWQHYDEVTKWTDMKIGVPLLFNFYHGIELFMKGVLIKCDTTKTLRKSGHDIERLLKELQSLTDNKPPNFLIETLQKAIDTNGPFNQFFEINNLSVSRYHELLRYPENAQETQTFSYAWLRDMGGIGLANFKEIRSICKQLKSDIQEWMRMLNESSRSTKDDN